MVKHAPPFASLLAVITGLLVTACGGSDPSSGNIDRADPPSANGSKGLVFVAHTPNPRGTNDIGTHTATFGNNLTSIGSTPRGGSLFLLQPDGKLRDLLDEALKNGCAAGGNAVCNKDGAFTVNDAGLLVNGYTVRRPAVHWDADKLLVSLVRGTIHEQHGEIQPADSKWQMYELTGLDPNDKPLIKKVPAQPAYNNFDAIYGSKDEIFFISDRPATGNAKHYPQLDEYETHPINSGLWRLVPETGELTLIDHSPSGDFGPRVTPHGQLVFTRWDHLQADQQASGNSMRLAIEPGLDDTWGAYTYADETDFGENAYTLVEKATKDRLQAYIDNDRNTALLRAAAEANGSFPEPNRNNPLYNWGEKKDSDGKVLDVAGTFIDANGDSHDIPFATPGTSHGEFNFLIFNRFLPWQMRQDGTGSETYRHTGLHEVAGFILRSYRNDPALQTVESTKLKIHEASGYFLNDVHVEKDTGFEILTGVLAPEFETHRSGAILQFVDTDVVAAPFLHENGDAVTYRFLTDPENDKRIYRDPFFLSDGRLVASVSDDARLTGNEGFDAYNFTLRVLEKNEETGFHEPAGIFMPAGVTRRMNYWLENGGLGLQKFSGRLWEVEPQEVIARERPAVPRAPALEDPELDMFAAVGVTPEQFTAYLAKNNLAAIVIRNATVRDEADVTQPFNLVVQKDGINHEQTTRSDYVAGETKLYPISYLQLMRGDYRRGYLKYASFKDDKLISDGGRRIQPTPLQMTGELAHNLPVAANAPVGAVPIQEDGSIAALLPARRALTWQTTDEDGAAIVRERYWLTFQPGEVRVCASCHGVNDRAQDNSTKPENPPEALRVLLQALVDAGEFIAE